ncbi:MAG: tryptophan synthase subunit alpha [Treponema sp. CETP13]|nr:MAG: tryptophan synthase subunit alpha [Treponema sp. CETP13]
MAILMAHQVAGYPDDETALIVADALIDGGAKILEVQLPFSDPSADGKIIQNANAKVLARGYTTQNGLDFIGKVHKKHPDIEIFLMSYTSIFFRPGMQNFVERAIKIGATGFIIGDLPFDCDEGLKTLCEKYNVNQIPVIAPSVTDERLSKVAHAGFKYIYSVLRAGITGQATTITDDMIQYIERCSEGGSKILGGFGIQNGEQSKTLAPHVYAVVAGSVFVNIISKFVEEQENKPTNEFLNSKLLYERIYNKAKELSDGAR